MGFGKKKSTPAPANPTPTISVQPESGSGMKVNPTTQQVQRADTVTQQATLLSQNDEDEALKKGLG
jgi:hypothetical protein